MYLTSQYDRVIHHSLPIDGHETIFGRAQTMHPELPNHQLQKQLRFLIGT